MIIIIEVENFRLITCDGYDSWCLAVFWEKDGKSESMVFEGYGLQLIMATMVCI